MITESDKDTQLASESKRIRYLSQTFPPDSLNMRISTATHQQVIEKGKCAKLRQEYKVSKYDNAQFIFNQKFIFDD